MSYAVRLDAKDVKCVVPVSDIPKLMEEDFEDIGFAKDRGATTVTFMHAWEEDAEYIQGKLVGDKIVLNSHQSGSYKNSSDGGLSILLEKYDGSAMVSETGEEGEQSVTKWINGVPKEGKVVFD